MRDAWGGAVGFDGTGDGDVRCRLG